MKAYHMWSPGNELPGNVRPAGLQYHYDGEWVDDDSSIERDDEVTQRWPVPPYVVTDNTETLKNAVIALEELQLENDELRNRIHNVGLNWLEKVGECQLTIKRLEDELIEKDKIRKEVTEELHHYKKATNHHTLENLEAIMGALPEAKDLEGENLCATGCWDDLTDENGSSRWKLSLLLIADRTPQYLEGNTITDAMVVEAGGRVLCEVRDVHSTPWKDELLMGVDPDSIMKFICWGDAWKHCRIKATDLEVAKCQS